MQHENICLTAGAVYWSILSVFVISVVLLSTSPKTDAEFVFNNFANTTGWSDGTAWMLGLLQSALSFIGFVSQNVPLPSIVLTGVVPDGMLSLTW
jgi:hypothetical protein